MIAIPARAGGHEKTGERGREKEKGPTWELGVATSKGTVEAAFEPVEGQSRSEKWKRRKKSSSRGSLLVFRTWEKKPIVHFDKRTYKKKGKKKSKRKSRKGTACYSRKNPGSSCGKQAHPRCRGEGGGGRNKNSSKKGPGKKRRRKERDLKKGE